MAITGTPGAGKTLLARKLSLFTHGVYLDLNKIAIKGGLKAGIDLPRKSVIINERGLFGVLKPYLKPGSIYYVDSHLSHCLPKSKVRLCIVAKASLGTLKKRLINRKYPYSKIKENLEVEAFGVCQTEAQENGHRVFEVDTTKGISKKSLSNIVSQIKLK